MALDTQQFLNMQTDEALSTELKNIDEGEYRAVVEDLDYREAQKRDGTGSVHFLDVKWLPDDPTGAIEQSIGRKPTVRQSLFLDIEGDALQTGEGRNVDLGRLRAAVGQNTPGKPWNPGMLIGSAAVIEVKHRIHEGRVFAEVKGVRSLESAAA